MSYIFKFKTADKVLNYVKTYPQASFLFYGGSTYLNNRYNLSGAFSGSILGVPNGYVCLQEVNVDRQGEVTTTTNENAFKLAVDNKTDPTDYYSGTNPKINSFIIKDGTRFNSKTVSLTEYNTILQLGDVVTGSYNNSASIHKFFYAATDSKFATSFQTGPGTGVTGSVTFLYALKNTLNFYQPLSPHYAVSSSQRDITSSLPAQGAVPVGLLTIPSILYGDTIQKGSIDLKFYVTGTLVGQLQDENRDGNLIQVGPYGSSYSGSVAGVALYNEGFLVLTGSWSITANNTAMGPEHTEEYGTGLKYPTWVNFAQTISSSATFQGGTIINSSFSFDFVGENTIPVMTLFANAPKNYLNHSNNSTYRDYSTPLFMSSGSTGYMQNNNALIKNTVSSSYNDPTGSFSKITYITTIGVYDASKNLIGIAKLSKPVKKREDRDLTFKLKLDI